MARAGRRKHGIVAKLALLATSLTLCLVGLEVGLWLTAGDSGGWFAAGPERMTFLRRYVRRNREGFRDREFLPKLRPGVERILAVGDSFTFGDGIRRVEDTWPRVLQRDLEAAGRDVEVDNLGVPGTNTAFQRDLLLRKGYPLGPSRIVLGFVVNDLEPPGANRDIVLRRIYVPLLPLGRLDTFSTRHSYAYAWLRGQKNLWLERLGLKPTYVDYLRRLYADPAVWGAFASCARGLVADADTRGVPVTVAIFPFFHDLEHYPFEEAHRRVAELFRSTDADVVDLLAIYRGMPTAELAVSPTDAHPNERAHRLAAEAIAARIEGSRDAGESAVLQRRE